MITAKELVEPIEIMAPPCTQSRWDNSGFSVGDPDGAVTAALIALDCTPEVVAEAVEKRCDIIITHHPLIFGQIRSVTRETWLGRTVMDAIRSGITVYSAHTNMGKQDKESVQCRACEKFKARRYSRDKGSSMRG